MEMDNQIKVYQIEMAPHTKVNVSVREDNKPTAEELEQIHKFYKKANEENVAVFEMTFCNTIPDRQDDIFTDTSIDTMVRTVIGKQYINGHDTSKDSIGKIFDSHVDYVDYTAEDGTTYENVKTGFIKVYIPRTKRHEAVIEDLETGMREYTSPGFTVNEIKCSICGNDYLGGKCQHIKGQEYDGVKCYTLLEVKECAEVSSVYLGAQYYSQIVKNLDGGEEMEVKELQIKIENLEKNFNDYKEKYSETSFNELTEKANASDGLIKVFGNVDIKELETIKENAEIGKEAKAQAVAEIKKLKALIDTAKGIATMEKSLNRFLEVADYTELKEYEKSLRDEANVIPVGKQTETQELEDNSNKKNLWK